MKYRCRYWYENLESKKIPIVIQTIVLNNNFDFLKLQFHYYTHNAYAELWHNIMNNVL